MDQLEEPPARRENEHPRPPLREIRIIVGGTTDGLERPVNRIRLKDSTNRQPYHWVHKDVRHLHHPHDDVLMVSIRVGDYNTH